MSILSVKPVSVIATPRFGGNKPLRASAWPNITTLRAYKMSLSSNQQGGARITDILIKNAVANGLIDPQRVYAICDVGASDGGSTFALKSIFKPSRGDIIALERVDECRNEIVRANIVTIPDNDLIDEDAIGYLTSPHLSIKFDLITAFNPNNLIPALNPDGVGSPEKLQEFILAAKDRLNPGGKLVLRTNQANYDPIKRFCVQNRFQCQDIPTPDLLPVKGRPLLKTMVIAFETSVR